MRQRTCEVGSRARGVLRSIMGGCCNRDGATGRARSQQVLSAAGARGHHHTRHSRHPHHISCLLFWTDGGRPISSATNTSRRHVRLQSGSTRRWRAHLSRFSSFARRSRYARSVSAARASAALRSAARCRSSSRSGCSASRSSRDRSRDRSSLSRVVDATAQQTRMCLLGAYWHDRAGVRGTGQILGVRDDQ